MAEKKRKEPKLSLCRAKSSMLGTRERRRREKISATWTVQAIRATCCTHPALQVMLLLVEHNLTVLKDLQMYLAISHYARSVSEQYMRLYLVRCLYI